MEQGITLLQCFGYHGIYCYSYSILTMMLFSVMDNYAVLHVAPRPFKFFQCGPRHKKVVLPDLEQIARWPFVYLGLLAIKSFALVSCIENTITHECHL